MTVDVVILGASHPAAEAILDLLGDRDFPVNNLTLLDDEDFTAQRLEFRGKPYRIKDIEKYSFAERAIVFNLQAEKQYLDVALEKHCYIIDCQAITDNAPLVIAGLATVDNPLAKDVHSYISPDALTVAIALSIDKIQAISPVRQLVVSSYQAVSSQLQEGISELATQTANLLNIKPVSSDVFDKQIAFNVIPQIGSLQENAYTSYELKIVEELNQLFKQSFATSLMCVSVPVFYGYAASLYVETEQKVDIQNLADAFQAEAGIEYLSGGDEEGVATPVTEAAGQPELFISRLREDLSGKAAITYWLVSDNIRHGMALNAVKIAEGLCEIIRPL